ncbi:low molecular weight phosphatase family protein [Candidatus Bathyarchaeota archaeon]|nr:low molecular weight phosphatase family protein [Candidatus Bathyarchaeota archaeon]
MIMKILFVCSGNAYRSPYAEALLKKQRPDLDVESAGLHVAIPIAREAKNYLRKLDAEQYLKSFPESLDEKNLRNYDLIIAMQPKHKSALLRKCPECESKIIVWNIKDPYFEEQKTAKKIYNAIENKVKELAKSL